MATAKTQQTTMTMFVEAASAPSDELFFALPEVPVPSKSKSKNGEGLGVGAGVAGNGAGVANGGADGEAVGAGVRNGTRPVQLPSRSNDKDDESSWTPSQKDAHAS